MKINTGDKVLMNGDVYVVFDTSTYAKTVFIADGLQILEIPEVELTVVAKASYESVINVGDTVITDSGDRGLVFAIRPGMATPYYVGFSDGMCEIYSSKELAICK